MAFCSCFKTIKLFSHTHAIQLKGPDLFFCCCLLSSSLHGMNSLISHCVGLHHQSSWHLLNVNASYKCMHEVWSICVVYRSLIHCYLPLLLWQWQPLTFILPMSCSGGGGKEFITWSFPPPHPNKVEGSGTWPLCWLLRVKVIENLPALM